VKELQAFAPDSVLVSRVAPSPNRELRNDNIAPNILILHYTGMLSTEGAIRWLAAPESRVSCHYVIDEAGAVVQMVPEADRAWHAGVSYWGGVTDINSCSIGIEIQNPGHAAGYPDFPEDQMRGVEDLCIDIVGRHRIKAHCVLAHSDIAPRRKIDPGEKFDWASLARAGIGHWVKPAPLAAGESLTLGNSGEAVSSLQDKLTAYGYEVGAAGEFDTDTQFAVAAFQRHFRPALVDGRADRSTVLTLDALLAALPAEE